MGEACYWGQLQLRGEDTSPAGQSPFPNLGSGYKTLQSSVRTELKGAASWEGLATWDPTAQGPHCLGTPMSRNPLNPETVGHLPPGSPEKLF